MRAVRVFVNFFIIYLAKSFKYRLKIFYLFCNNNEFFIFLTSFYYNFFIFFKNFVLIFLNFLKKGNNGYYFRKRD